jgi:protein PhnA
MSDPLNCPKCKSDNIYKDQMNWVCPECFFEWSGQIAESNQDIQSDIIVFKDAFGQVLVDGDSITVIKELKIKGSSSVVKVGTKVKNIKLADQGNGHDISCRIDGVGSIQLKSEFVKKA